MSHCQSWWQKQRVLFPLRICASIKEESKYLKYSKIYMPASHFQNWSTVWGSLCQKLAGLSFLRAGKRATALCWCCLEQVFPHIIMLCSRDTLWAQERNAHGCWWLWEVGRGARGIWLHYLHGHNTERSASSRAARHPALPAVAPKRDCIEENMQVPNLLMNKGLASIIWVPSIHLHVCSAL